MKKYFIPQIPSTDAGCFYSGYEVDEKIKEYEVRIAVLDGQCREQQKKIRELLIKNNKKKGVANGCSVDF